jgi:hypothetical protein
MAESKCLVKERKIPGAQKQRTILHFISNVNIQFNTMSVAMRRWSFYSVSIAFIIAGLLTPIALDMTSVFAQQPPPFSSDNLPPPPQHYPIPFGQPPSGHTSNFTFGPIASIQNNESGQSAWLIVGHWRGNLLSFNQTATENNDEDASSAAAALFNANLRMIMLNGSGAHSHVITNFRLSDVSSDANGTMTYAGNSTIGMPEAPIVDVPTTIKISDEIISIFPDPSSVNDHFGSTPIYGVIEHGSENNTKGPSRPGLSMP